MVIKNKHYAKMRPYKGPPYQCLYMKKADQKKAVQTFLEENKLAILSTVDQEGRPHAAPIYYVLGENFEVFFITPLETQKNINLDHQNEVVLTITNEKNWQTLQLRGQAERRDDITAEILNKLTSRLNMDMEFITSLPLMKHKSQFKTAIRIKPAYIRLRSYEDDGLKEAVIEF